MVKKNSASSEWFEKESKFFEKSMLALIGAIFASNLTTLSIMGQPFSWKISLYLFVFCILFRIKYHFLEPRLSKFYECRSRDLKNREKSIEQLIDELYLYIGYALCLSLLHFYVFLTVFLIYLILDQWYTTRYLNYAKRATSDWSGGIFNPKVLFRRWVCINYVNIILILIAISSIATLNINANLVAFLFISLIFVIEILIDWFFLNRDFYFDSFA